MNKKPLIGMMGLASLTITSIFVFKNSQNSSELNQKDLKSSNYSVYSRSTPASVGVLKRGESNHSQTNEGNSKLDDESVNQDIEYSFDLNTLKLIVNSKEEKHLPFLLGLGRPENPYLFSNMALALEEIAKNSLKPTVKLQASQKLMEMAEEEIIQLEVQSDARGKRGASGNLIIALESIGHIAEPSSVSYLGRFLEKDLDYLVYKSTAVQSLGMIGTAEAIPFLNGYIDELRSRDQDDIDTIESLKLASETRDVIVEFSQM